MKVSNPNSNTQNPLNYLSLTNYKFNKNSVRNNRYQNLQNNPINSANSNISNNNLLYDSYNKRGYNGILDPSLSGNNNVLIIKNSQKNPYQNVKVSNSKSISNKLNSKSEIAKKGKKIQKISENNFEPNKLIQTNSTTYLSRKMNSNSNENFLKWNNIGFKEIIHKNKFEMPSYDIFNKNNLFKSYQILPSKQNEEIYRPTAKNLGFFNDNLTTSYNPYLNNDNIKYNQSTNYLNPKTALLETNRQDKNINYSNEKNKIILNTTRTKVNNYKTPDYIRSIEMDKDNKIRTVLKNEIILKKSKNILNNDIPPKNQLIYSYNKNLNSNSQIPKKYNYEYDDKTNSYLKNSHLYKSLVETNKDKNKNKNKEKTKTPNNYKKNNISLYQYYKDVIKKPKAENELGNNYLYSKYSKDYNKNKDENYINKVSKIQSIWRGGYVRELMSYYWSFSKFKELLNLIIINHLKKDFFNNLKLLKDKNNNINNSTLSNENAMNKLKNASININAEIKNENKSDINKLKNNLTKKEEDYAKLLKDYNYIVKQFSEIKEKNKDFKNIYQYNAPKNKEMELKQFITKSDNFNIVNNNKKIKKFENILKEKKEELNIIQNENIEQNESNNNNKSIKLRARKRNLSKEKENENNINEELITNNNKIDYNDYLNHFNSNLNIINNEKILIEQNPSKKENNQNKSEYEIINYNLALVNNNSNKKEEIKEICKNEPICIINNNSKNQTIFDNDSIINKSNINENNELTTITSGKDKESKFNFIPENQIDLNTLKSKLTENYIIEKQKDNNINIISLKNKNEFNKDCITINNEILLNIFSEKKCDENNKDKKESLDLDKNKNINIYENERFYLINKISKSKNKELEINKNEEIFLLQNKKDIKFSDGLSIYNTDNLTIKSKEIKKCDKSTEISEELNKIEQNNNSEIIPKLKKEDFVGETINIENDLKNKIEPDNKIILKEKQEFHFINNSSKNKKLNYNDINEIDKTDGLEINPYEIQRTQNNIHNIFISYENKMEMINNKESIYAEKAKRNMMKIILPIRIKSVLKEWIKKNVFKLLINSLKKISFISHLLLLNNKYINKNKKYCFEKFKDNAKIVKIKNYYLKEIGKLLMKNMLRKYGVYKWNINLNELAKLIISNEDLIKKIRNN